MKGTENKSGEKMQVYEVGYIILPSLTEEKVTEEVSGLRGAIEAAGAAIIAEEFPKLRTLAYTMDRSLETKRQKFNEGYFGWIKFDLPVAEISKVKSELEKRQNILRHLVIKTVRENTLFGPKLSSRKGEEGEVAEGEPTDAGVTINLANTSEDTVAAAKKEIDKSIDALVIN